MTVERRYLTREVEEGRTFSRGVAVRGDATTVYLAGVTNRLPDRTPVTGTFADRAHAAFQRLAEAVELAGGQLTDVVTMTTFIVDDADRDEFTRVRAEYFEPGRFPASALVTVASFAHPDIVLEIQAIAVIDD